MKFIYKIALSLSAVMLVFMAVWGVFFFRVMVAEVNDETDDMLEEYSQDIILRWLSGVNIPSTDNGTNNTYYVREVSSDYADSRPRIIYEDTDIWLASENEYEPARVRRQIFMDSDSRYFELTVAVPTFERQDLIVSLLWSMIVLYLVLLVSVLAITVAVIMYNMRPFNALMKWLDSYIPGKKNAPVPSDTDIVEFRKLAEAVQSAADRFERLYDQQKQFISNASHELQTPLAVCSGRLEMLLDSPGLSEEQAQELVKMHRTLQDLIRLNRTLLLMSKIENGQFLESEAADLGRILKDNAGMFDEVYAHKGIRAVFVEEGRFVVKINGQLASVLVNNLLKNAYFHSPADSVIEIDVHEDGFSISNPGDAPLDRTKIFTRFYQENSRKEGSTGLGLALVKTVCDSYGLSVDYEYDGRHRFTVRK